MQLLTVVAWMRSLLSSGNATYIVPSLPARTYKFEKGPAKPPPPCFDGLTFPLSYPKLKHLNTSGGGPKFPVPDIKA